MPLMQYNISNMHYRHLYLHPLMHIITYKNGMSRNGNNKSKVAIRLKCSFVWQNSYMFLGYCKHHIRNTFYDIKSGIVVKS